MKIRGGFVSNSSSTSFTFVFKEDNIEDCFNILKKYKDYFNLYDIDTGTSINGDEVIAQMKSYIDEVYHIDNCLVELEEQKQSYFNIMQEDKKRGFEDDLFYSLYNDAQMKVEKIKDLKDKGFRSFFSINFGDNHGDISGPPIGSGMDYEGRDIELKEDDVYMFTEQDR